MISIDEAMRRAREAGKFPPSPFHVGIDWAKPGDDRTVFTIRMGSVATFSTWRTVGETPAAAFRGTGPMLDMVPDRDGVWDVK